MVGLHYITFFLNIRNFRAAKIPKISSNSSRRTRTKPIKPSAVLVPCITSWHRRKYPAEKDESWWHPADISIPGKKGPPVEARSRLVTGQPHIRLTASGYGRAVRDSAAPLKAPNPRRADAGPRWRWYRRCRQRRQQPRPRWIEQAGNVTIAAFPAGSLAECRLRHRRLHGAAYEIYQHWSPCKRADSSNKRRGRQNAARRPRRAPSKTNQPMGSRESDPRVTDSRRNSIACGWSRIHEQKIRQFRKVNSIRESNGILESYRLVNSCKCLNFCLFHESNLPF